MSKFVHPANVWAGLALAFILLPEAIAYAAIAQLPVIHAITAVVLGLLCYAAIGTSRFAVVAPTSSSAALLAAALLAASGPAGVAPPPQAAFALVVLTGAGLLVLALLRLGRLAAFVSRPVLAGFSFAVALSIIVRQLPTLLGISVDTTSLLHILIQLVKHATGQAWASSLLGLGALLVLHVLKRWPRFPASLTVLATGIGLGYVWTSMNAQIAMVGPISLASPTLAWPRLDIDQWLRLAELAGALLVIVFAESWGSIRNLGLRHSERAQPNRELWALGVANLVSGLFQGMPVGAGFSASCANEAAGARSKAAAVVAAGMVLLVLYWGLPLVERIPRPVLAATVISALLHLLAPYELFVLWRIKRDHYLALAAIAAVLFFGLLHGMLIAVALSVLGALRSFSQPVVRELAELDHTRNYVDRENHPESVLAPQVLILRPEEPLFFASVDGVLEEVQLRLSQRPQTRVLVLSLEQCADLDSSAAQSLIELAQELATQGQILLLARVKDTVRQLLLQLAPQTFQGKLFWSVADAAQAAVQQGH